MGMIQLTKVVLIRSSTVKVTGARKKAPTRRAMARIGQMHGRSRRIVRDAGNTAAKAAACTATGARLATLDVTGPCAG